MAAQKVFIYTGGVVYTEHLCETPADGDYIIAADAGLLTAQKLGYTPNVLVGDFDTLGQPKDLPDSVEVIRLPVEKDMTDTQYALSLALEKDPSEIIMIGGLEGRLDHTLAFLSSLEELTPPQKPKLFGKKKKPEPHRIPAVITNGKNRVRFLRDGGTILLRSPYRFFSLLAATDRLTHVTIEGAKYPLKNATLYRSNQWAISNEIEGNCALIEFRSGGAWLVESMD